MKNKPATQLYPGVILRGNSIIVTKENYEATKPQGKSSSTRIVIAKKKTASGRLAATKVK